MRKLVSTLLTLALVMSFALAVPVAAEDPVDPPNTVESSTMIFQGSLTDNKDGTYSGTIPMVDEAAMSLGDKIAGFDVYAKWGGTAYIEGMDPDNWTIGSNHDAYAAPGPWGAWYDPDCADWEQYSLELTEDHWYLRYTSTSESPMSGTMDWHTMYAAETDKGTDDTTADETDPVNCPYLAGSAQEWGWNCGWGEERIPLQFAGFDVQRVDLGGGDYRIIMRPAPESRVGLTAEVPDIVAISVDPTSIDFGALLPGTTSDVFNLTVENIGTHTVNVDAEVHGSPLFLGNLKLGLAGGGWFPVGPSDWGTIITNLVMNGSKDLKTELPVPPDYIPGGTERGALVFEAAPA